MRHITIFTAAALSLATTAGAQMGLYAMTSGGELVRLDPATGAGTLVGPTGLGGANAAAADSRGRIFRHSSDSSQLILVDPATGAGSIFLNLTGRPIGYGIRGMAFDSMDQLYAAMSKADTSEIDILVRIDMATGAYTQVGPTGRTDIQDIAFDNSSGGSGTLYAAGVFGGLYTLDPATGAATVIGGSLAGDDQALSVDDHGTLFCCRSSLRTVDTATGLTTLIGPTGFADLRGMMFVHAPIACYANCDGSTAAPVLNVNDFICFQSQFAAGATYANCDGSTAPPVLNVNDFICFQSQFARGCP